LPLAPVSAVTEAEVPSVIEQMKARLQGRPQDQAKRLWTSTYFLMGLRYSDAKAHQFLEGIRGMEESATYQATIARGEAKGEAKGRIEGIKEALLVMGREQFGPPSAQVKAALNAITDLDRLKQLSVRLLKVNSWQNLLDLPPGRSRQRKQTP
jgi:hypothetical protein